MTIDEIRGVLSLPEVTSELEAMKAYVRHQHISRLQSQHEKTVQLMQDVEELQEVIEKFDSRVHWLDWMKVGDEGEPTIAMCGATIHDGKHWFSMAAFENYLSSVTCKECSDLPEYNLKLLGQADLGDSTKLQEVETGISFATDNDTGFFRAKSGHITFETK